MIMIMGERSLIILYAILMFLLHLKPAIGFTSRVEDDSVMCIERERQALLEFKKGLVDHHGRLSSWGSEDEKKNCCNWEGVHCSNQTSRVLELHLNAYQIDGFQRLLGPRFPNWIRTQRKLSFPDISDANILDTILDEWLEDLPPTIRVLNLSSNQIHGRLPNVSAKRLNGLAIDLSANRIEGPLPLFPTNLKILKLSKNRFSGSISSLCKINGQLLTLLDLSHNILSGQLPNCFMHWHKLIILDLAGNNFIGEVPSSLGLLSQLQTLRLNDNNFSGHLPSSLRNCNSLTIMDLGNNRFSGKVPAWIGEGLPRLIFLLLGSNKFYGSIPLHLCWLKNLQILDLCLNDISGTIPQCINNFTAMAQKGKFSIDTILTIIHGNNLAYLHKYVYSAMFVLKRKEYVYSNNLGLLKIINLSSNKLSGKLPSKISGLLEFVVLNVSRNNLIGEIPHMIGQLKQLESLDLSRNQFSGEIPFSMSDLNFLSDLDLSYNNLSGKIPSSTQLQSLNANDFIGNTALCGPPLKQKCPGEETSNQTFLETCLFLIIGQHKGLALCNNDGEHDKIVEELSEAWMMIRSG
uniref:Leucine-rich repeat-containing N-terminal plant-type domain-containing protein n=1 Tax=Quercus lobata TaxID=97700 RepID=A0A7N2MJA8_QUELO